MRTLFRKVLPRMPRRPSRAFWRKGITADEARRAVAAGAKRVREADFEQVLRQEGRIRELASQGPLSRLFDEVQMLLALIRAYWKGEYRAIPWFSMAATVSALLYVLTPIDLIPDLVPLFGYVDDAAVVAACLALVREDLERFKAWRGASAQ
jgi:uncharacterized membrane protein YkvA (DUF1232 family)